MDEAPPDTLAVCDAFDLGTPIGTMSVVPGGLSHRMWRLATARGHFAVKELNRNFDDPGYMPWFERAFAVELAALRAGLPLPRPVPVVTTGACLAELPSPGTRPTTVRVHEWLDGVTVPMDARDPAVAAQVGTILARLHALRLPTPVTIGEMLRAYGGEHWHGLVERLEAANVSWAPHLSAALAVIDELEGFVADARTDPAPLIMSHRDAYQNNVIIPEDGRAKLVDWDGAGPVNPRHEVATAALNWAGVHLGEPDPGVARAMTAAYRAGGGEFDAPRKADFVEFIGDVLSWLEYNIRRTLGERLHDESDRALGDRQARQMLENLPRFERSLDSWARDTMCA